MVIQLVFDITGDIIRCQILKSQRWVASEGILKNEPRSAREANLGIRRSCQTLEKRYNSRVSSVTVAFIFIKAVDKQTNSQLVLCSEDVEDLAYGLDTPFNILIELGWLEVFVVPKARQDNWYEILFPQSRGQCAPLIRFGKQSIISLEYNVPRVPIHSQPQK